MSKHRIVYKGVAFTVERTRLGMPHTFQWALSITPELPKGWHLNQYCRLSEPLMYRERKAEIDALRDHVNARINEWKEMHERRKRMRALQKLPRYEDVDRPQCYTDYTVPCTCGGLAVIRINGYDPVTIKCDFCGYYQYSHVCAFCGREMQRDGGGEYHCQSGH